MKKRLSILIVITILLCGCGNHNIKQNLEKTVTTTSTNNEHITTESNKEEWL